MQEKDKWIPINPNYNPNKPMQVGGQAVIEGVMMRAQNAIATAVRRANGDIVVNYHPYKTATEKYKWLNVPILRGAIGLIDMMYLGIKTLNFSAEVAMLDVDKDKSSDKKEKKKSSSQSNFALIGTLIFALAIGMIFFFALPMYITTKVFEIEQTAFAFNITTGAIRIIFLITYMYGISFMKDVKQLFSYHGAEHKSVFAFELNATLNPESVSAYSRFHPRCGTSFLFIVAIVAIFSFSLIDAILLQFLDSLSFIVRILTHMPLIPIVGGIAYEVIKFSAKNSATWWGRIIIAPGLWLQHITTKEPNNGQIEVAIVALKCALGQEDPAKYPIPQELLSHK